VVHTDAIIDTRAQKMVSHTTHYRIGFATRREAKHFNSISYFVYAWVVYTAHSFSLPHSSNTDETRQPNPFNNYCVWSPSYRSVE